MRVNDEEKMVLFGPRYKLLERSDSSTLLSWSCDACGIQAGMTVWIESCPGCGHIRCVYCSVERHKVRDQECPAATKSNSKPEILRYKEILPPNTPLCNDVENLSISSSTSGFAPKSYVLFRSNVPH